MIAAHLHIGRVEPDIGPVALERSIEEGFYAGVDLLAQARDLALRDACCAHRPDEIVDRAGRDAVDIGFLGHRRQRPLGHPARLEEARKDEPFRSFGMRSSAVPARVSQSRPR